MPTDVKLLAKRIGQAIAAARQRKGLTQEVLGELLGVEKETISRFERGVVLPPLPRLAQLADTLDVPIDNLLRGNSGRPTDQAQQLEQLLGKLSEADRELVMGWFTGLCGRLVARP